MNKPVYQSKTLWGFGIAALITLLQIFGITDSTAITEALKVIGGSLGVFGLRDAI